MTRSELAMDADEISALLGFPSKPGRRDAALYGGRDARRYIKIAPGLALP